MDSIPLMRLLFLLLISLSACTPRANLDLVPDPLLVGRQQEVFVGSTRTYLPEAKNFGSYQRGKLSYARYTISLPPVHQKGRIELPGRATPDPGLHMVATARSILDAAQFKAQLARTLRQGNNEAVVYVHGFNNTLGDGVLRLSQMTNDLGLSGTPVSYSWPSAGNPLNYAYDRDSALFARDGLEALLNDIASSGSKNILLVAHSMGSLLTMETLRQLSIGKNTKVLSRIRGVVLISPDIDVELFHQQATRIGALPQPFIVFTSERDRALQLSARLTGQTDRLGTLRNLEAVADLKVTFFDVTQFASDADSSGHFVAGSSPTLLRILGQLGNLDAAFQREATARTGLLPGTVLTVQNATQIILSPVTVLGTLTLPTTDTAAANISPSQ
jgi:esterase/lipase superfamily enzyme